MGNAMSVDVAPLPTHPGAPCLAAFGLLAYLDGIADDQGWVWGLSTDRLGQLVGRSGRVIIRYLDQLEDAGLIRRRLVGRGSRPSDIRVMPS